MSKALASHIAQEFAKEALLKSTAKLAEAIYAHAVEPAEEFMEKATKEAIHASGSNNADSALNSKTSMIDCYVEAMDLQTQSEEDVQNRNFTATVDAKYSDIALADLVLTLEELRKTLFEKPDSFFRELSVGLIRLKDEAYLQERAKKYGGDVSRLLKEDPTIHKVEERSGNLVLLGPLAGIGKWSNPDFSFDGFPALATEVNTATLMELSRTAVKDLPLTLAFRFWITNPSLTGGFFADIFREVFNKAWFERRPDGTVWVDFDQSDENGLVWLASYYLQTRREFTEEERKNYAQEGAKKVYAQIKDKPVINLQNTDIF